MVEEQTSEESVAALRAFRTACTVRASQTLSPIERDTILAIRDHFFHIDADLDDLTLIEGEELARLITRPEIREQTARGLMIIGASDHLVIPEKLEAAYSLCSAMNVHKSVVEGFKELAHGHLALATLDFLRRNKSKNRELAHVDNEHDWKDKNLDGLWAHLAPHLDAPPDEALANRYNTLADLPGGTLGRDLYEYYKRHGFHFPGEEGGVPEFPFVVHDLTHVLGEYEPTPDGEMGVLAFTGGYRRGHGFDSIYQGLVHFHLGLRLDPKIDPTTAEFRPDYVMAQVERGSRMNTDLFHAWDYHKDFESVTAAVRTRFGILPS